MEQMWMNKRRNGWIKTAVCLLAGMWCSLLSAGERGEYHSIALCPYPSAQLTRIRACVDSDPEAGRRAQELLQVAATHLERSPEPVKVIHYEGLLNTDPKRIACVEHLLDMRVLGQVLHAWAASGEEKWADLARTYIKAWTETYRPTGNPINENKLEPILVGYFSLRDGFSPAERRRIEDWVKTLTNMQASKSPKANNWGAKRLKLMLLGALILDDHDLVARVKREVRRYVDRSLYADGSSNDLRYRDAMSYHCSGLAPMLQVLTILAGHGHDEDFWSYVGTKGGSLEKSVAFVLPYARREKIYHQWQNSRSEIDKRRAAAGIAKYRPGVAYDPGNAVQLLEWATLYQTGLVPIIAELLESEDTNFPTWRLVELHCLGEN